MASLLDLLGLGPNVAPWFPAGGSEAAPPAPAPAPIAEAPAAEGPFERLMREAQQLPAADIYRQGVGLPPSAKVPSPDFNAPLPGLGPSWRDQFTPGLETAKGLIGGALEPFAQAGRLMTGASQDVSGDLAGALAAATPMGKLGKLAKPAAEAAEAATGGLGDFIKAYHGSPHDFERFDLSKIGTGEGAQAYGHGLYFAENPKTAEAYKGTVPNGLGPLNIRNFWTPAEVPSGKGKMYEVAIKANPEHFLDWDKPLSEQHPHVQKAVHAAIPDDDFGRMFKSGGNDPLGSRIHQFMADAHGSGNQTARDQAAGTAALREAGIPGIKYLDQGSRGKGEGTRNFVVFDDKLIDILKKYGIAGIGALPAMNAYHYQDQQ